MRKFIYVFCREAKQKLLDAGFMLIREDKKNNLYIFVNDGALPFADEDYAYLLTDTLTM